MQTARITFYGNEASLHLFRCLCLILCGLSLLGLRGNAQANQPAVEDHKLRVILSAGTLANTNVNDATAAFRVWMSQLGKNLNLPIASDVVILSSMEEISRELDGAPNHLVSLSLPEYLSFAPSPFSQSIYMGQRDRDAGAGVHYLLLVRESSSIQELSALSGKKLVQYDHIETAMSQEWLNYSLANAGLISATELLGSYTKEKDLSKAVLGVFFGKNDACIVSDTSFNLLCELNPQLRKQLVVLAQSLAIINGAVFIQKDYDNELDILVGQSIEQLGKDIYGKQILTLFASDAVYRTDLSELQGSLDLYKKWTNVREEHE